VNPIGPRGVYDEAKRFAEAITMAYHRYHRVDTRIVRIFNTYGPRMRLRDGRVVPAFIGQASERATTQRVRRRSQTRSFCYVSDLIDGIFRLAMSDFHEPVNLGNPREMTLNSLQRKSSGSRAKSTIEYKPLPWTTRRCANRTLAARKKCSVGNREFSSTKVSRRRSTILKRR
jgi:Nucleoside-diphosphate-sugar epimerases